MFRRIAAVSITLALAAAAACGRQVTPDPSTSTGNNNLGGKMLIRFRTRGQLNFNMYNYVIVFNTSGQGGEPYPQSAFTSYTNYSYAFAVGASYGGAGVAVPTLFQYAIRPGTSNQLNPLLVSLGASTTQLELQTTQAANEFQLIFTRAQLDNPLQLATPTPGPAVPNPTGSTNATPTAVPSPLVTTTPAVGPSGFAPTPTIPSAQPTTNGQRYWFINFFTIDRNNTVLDSLGIGGPTDTSYSLGIDTATTNLNPVFRPGGITYPADQAAAIDGGEVDNYL